MHVHTICAKLAASFLRSRIFGAVSETGAQGEGGQTQDAAATPATVRRVCGALGLVWHAAQVEGPGRGRD